MAREREREISSWRAIGLIGGAVLLAKVALIGLSLHGTLRAASAADASGAPSLAVVPPARPAAEAAPGGPPAAVQAAPQGDVGALLASLTRRQSELDARERELAEREARLAIYEKDVTEKVARLEQLARSLEKDMRRAEAAADEAAASLAKVYGAMAPAEAAPLLEQLDEATALRIVSRMKEKQVGEVLPRMSRERALVLTRALAGRGTAARAATPAGKQAQGS